MLLVVNAAIIATALLMAVLCCRRAGGGYISPGPYTYIPGKIKPMFERDIALERLLIY